MSSTYLFQCTRQSLNAGTADSSNEHTKKLAKKDPNRNPTATLSN